MPDVNYPSLPHWLGVPALVARPASTMPPLGWAGLGWAGLGWAGLGWAGLVTTQPSCCCLAAEAGKELATTKPNYLAVMQFKIFYDIFCLKYKIFFCLVYETMKKCWREVGGVSQRVVVAPSEHAQRMAGGRSGRGQGTLPALPHSGTWARAISHTAVLYLHLR